MDTVGTPLANVRIADATKAVYTDVNGNYSIDEPLGEGFTLTASRTGLYAANKSGTALPMTTVDFVLLYVISSTVSPTAFNTLPKPLDLTVRSFAPTSSCISWIDATSGISVALVYQSTSESGESTWTGQYEVPADRTEGAHSYTSVGQSCSQGTDLTKRISGSYKIDFTPPVVEEIIPIDDHNTSFQSQPLIAKVSDGLAGVDDSSVSFELSKQEGETETLAATKRFDGRYTSTPANLATSSRYRIRVTATDQAGNAASAEHSSFAEDGGFLVVSATPSSDTASIPVSDCQLLPGGAVATTQEVECPLDLSYPATSVAVTGSNHAGSGHVRRAVPLDGVVIRYEVLGLPQEKSDVLDGETAIADFRFDVYPGGDQSAAIPVATRSRGPVRTELPLGAQNPEILMPSTPATSVVTGSCADVTSVSAARVRCDTDPFLSQYFVTLDTTANVEDASAQHADEYDLTVGYTYNSPVRGYVAVVPWNRISEVATADEVQSIIRDERSHLNATLEAVGEFAAEPDGTYVAVELSSDIGYSDANGVGRIPEPDPGTPPPPDDPPGDSGGFECVKNEQGGTSVQSVHPVTHTSDALVAEHLFHIYSRVAARYRSDWQEESFQVLSCGAGGGDAQNGWRTGWSGNGSAVKSSTTYKIGHKWKSASDTPADYSINLGFQLDIGIANVTAGISQTPRDRLTGSIAAPNGNGNYSTNRANGWWQEKCIGSTKGCSPFSGSRDWQGAASEVLWEFRMSDAEAGTLPHIQLWGYWTGWCSNVFWCPSLD